MPRKREPTRLPQTLPWGEDALWPFSATAMYHQFPMKNRVNTEYFQRRLSTGPLLPRAPFPSLVVCCPVFATFRSPTELGGRETEKLPQVLNSVSSVVSARKNVEQKCSASCSPACAPAAVSGLPMVLQAQTGGEGQCPLAPRLIQMRTPRRKGDTGTPSSSRAKAGPVAQPQPGPSGGEVCVAHPDISQPLSLLSLGDRPRAGRNHPRRVLCM